ncbi:MAG: hypothetical protein LBR32_05120, partial [Propionibacteriaceae bacterium]|nr:hypothetical protein [Propionibacteriaceae bacterium]
LNSASWLYFWTFNEGRGADLGSLWYLLQLVGYPVADPSRMETILMVVGTLVICALLLFAPRRPRLAQGVFLIVAWFLVVNKVYSPQYVLWLLPLLALARPRWLDWAVFSISETCYFAAIWLYLNDLTIDNAGSYPYYWFAIMLRIAVQLWLCAKVVYDIFHPEADVVRAHGRDDPDGGALDWAADANWVRGIAPVAPQPTTYR